MGATTHAQRQEFTAAGQSATHRLEWPRGQDGLDISFSGTFEAVIAIQAKRPDQPDSDYRTIREVTAPLETVLEARGDYMLRFLVTSYVSGTAILEVR